jgi:hypothetical protein
LLPEPFKFDATINFTKKGIITASPNIPAGKKSCASLTDKYRAGSHKLAFKSFYAKPFPAAITTVY